MDKYFLIFAATFLFCCKAKTPEKATTLPQNTDKTVIAFGSCNDEEILEQPLWNPIIKNKPNLWIWLGDIIYGDTDDMLDLIRQYGFLYENEGYKKLKETCPIVGTWDDHDYGLNNGGKEWRAKDQNKEVLLDFLGASSDDVRRKREGIYYSYTLGKKGTEVKVILLDCRYFRDSSVVDKKKRYIKNETGTILGEAQWVWLENELENSSAQVHIIGSGIQVIPEEHRFEKWANFPNERQRLFDLLTKTKPANPVIISGDRHIAELSKIELKGLKKPLYEVTSSGMTHSFERILEVGETNQYRVNNYLSGEKNFGLFFIDWDKKPIEIKAEVHGIADKVIFSQVLK